VRQSAAQNSSTKLAQVAEGIADKYEFVNDLGTLKLDPKNPRLPKTLRSASQEELLKHIENQYEPILVGRSIAAHGFFFSEPLITVEEEGDSFVVEGNRRLTALKLLTEPESRELVTNAEWEQLAVDVRLPKQGIPVVRAASRDAVAPIIGYRHIAGIQEWDPFPKAQFITQLVDAEEKSFIEVAQLVGENEGEVRRLYRNYGVVEQAQELGIDTSRVEAGFGVFDRALVGGIREYVSAPAPSAIAERAWPLPDSDDVPEKLDEVFSWIFGDEKHEAVFSDSRSLSTLSKVLRSDDGVEALRRTRDLQEAEEAAGGPRARLLENLAASIASLKSAQQDLSGYRTDKAVISAVRKCEELASELRKKLDG
jgi:hypothetical protein